MGRVRNARGEGTRLRDEIVASATALLEETGSPEAITLRAVARGAGVTAPSIYAHFADRDEIVEAVLTESFARFAADLHAALGDAAGPKARLFAGCHAYVRFAREHPQRYAVLFRRSQVPSEKPVSREEFLAFTGGDGFGILVDSISSCAAAGLSTSTDPFADASALWAGLHGYATLLTSNPSFPWPADDGLVDTLVERLARLS